MKTQKQKSTTEQNNYSIGEFFYNKFSNMKVGLTRAERKLNAKKKFCKKKCACIEEPRTPIEGRVTGEGSEAATSSYLRALSIAKITGSINDQRFKGGLGEKIDSWKETSKSNPSKNSLKTTMEESSSIHNKSAAEEKDSRSEI